jgi:hypothetical protein
MLAAPRRCETVLPSIRNKIFACLATRFDVRKSDIQSVIKLDQPIVQYGRVSRLEGGDLMVGCHLVKQTAEDSRDASFVRVSLAFFFYLQFLRSLLQYSQLVDRHAHHRGKTPDFELQNCFGQLNRILLLELPSSQRLKLDGPTTVIVALIREVKATLRNGIYYYKNFGGDEVVDLSTLQCVVGRIRDRDEWAIIDRSDNVDIQGD